jgi:hypothetical protein
MRQRGRRCMMRAGLMAAVLLLLGFLTSVGVAWGLAMRLPHPGWEVQSFESEIYEDRWISLSELRAFGVTRRTWFSLAGNPSMSGTTPIVEGSEVPRASPRLKTLRSSPALAQWGRGSQALLDPRSVRRFGDERASGWPLLAGWCGLDWLEAVPSGFTVHCQGGILFTPWRSTRMAQRPNLGACRALPVRPIWPGVAADTAVYAGVWWLLLLAPGQLRRRLRRRRGRCTRCGYDLTGLTPGAPCPECGGEPAASQGPGRSASVNG